MAQDARRLRSAGARGVREPSRAVGGRPFSILWSLARGHEAQGRQVSARRSPDRSPSPGWPPSVPRAGSAEHPAPPPSRERESAALRGRGSAVTWSRGGRRGGRRAGRGGGAESRGRGRGGGVLCSSAPRRGSDTQRARSRRAGPAASATASAASEASRAAGSAAAAAAGRPRRAGLGSGRQRRRSHQRSRSGSPTALGWAGLGRAQGAGRRGGRAGKDARAGLAPGERPGTAPGPAPPRSALPSASPRARADEPRARGTWKR